MSADNWTYCPRCRQEESHRLAALAKRVAAEYGKLPIEKFDALRDELAKGEQIEATFREDYEFYGADEGTVTAVYSGHCQTCGLGIDFQYEREFFSETLGDIGSSLTQDIN